MSDPAGGQKRLFQGKKNGKIRLAEPVLFSKRAVARRKHLQNMAGFHLMERHVRQIFPTVRQLFGVLRKKAGKKSESTQ